MMVIYKTQNIYWDKKNYIINTCTGNNAQKSINIVTEI